MDDATSEQHLPEPALPPDVDDRVRALLAAGGASTPAMPDAVEERILSALKDETRRAPGAARVPEIPRRTPPTDHKAVQPLLRRQQRPQPLLAAAAVAAAAAVVAVGGSALHLATRPSGSAVAVVGTAPTGTSATSSDRAPRVHIQLSRTAYDATTIASQARALLTAPGTPLREGAAESPSLGPIATEIGLTSCLRALGEREPDSVSADLATYAGEPAAIIVVTMDGSSTAYAVRRHCTTGDSQVLLGPTPVP